MSENKAGRFGGHAFSIEIKSMRYVKRVAMPNENGDSLLIEGFLGSSAELSLVEGVMLEIRGDNGMVRMEIGEEELMGLVAKGGKTH